MSLDLRQKSSNFLFSCDLKKVSNLTSSSRLCLSFFSPPLIYSIKAKFQKIQVCWCFYWFPQAVGGTREWPCNWYRWGNHLELLFLFKNNSCEPFKLQSLLEIAECVSFQIHNFCWNVTNSITSKHRLHDAGLDGRGLRLWHGHLPRPLHRSSTHPRGLLVKNISQVSLSFNLLVA